MDGEIYSFEKRLKTSEKLKIKKISRRKWSNKQVPKLDSNEEKGKRRHTLFLWFFYLVEAFLLNANGFRLTFPQEV